LSLILLTNDDGVNSPGLVALKEALDAVGEVVIFAPDHNWSAAGHRKTMHKPLRVQETTLADGSPALVTNGGPADCVALAVLGVLPQLPDLVISGINPGSNLAQDMTYSGTVAASLEALISGIPALAVSVAVGRGGSADYRCAARYTALVATKVLSSGRKDLVLNVNVPAVPCDQIKGVEITRLGTRIYRDVLVRRRDPRGKEYYWIGGEPPTGVIEDGTDIGALAADKVSVTPLQLDLTARHAMEDLKAWQLGVIGEDVEPHGAVDRD
jgi:5'-nucleotidase